MAARVYSIACTAWVSLKNICSTNIGGGGGATAGCLISWGLLILLGTPPTLTPVVKHLWKAFTHHN
jgi:hypothetical protein